VNCGNLEDLEERTTIPRTNKDAEDKIVVIGDDNLNLSTVPKTKVNCPKCGHGEAYTREQSIGMGVGTLIMSFKCVNCGHTWRSE
jgi:DNA-directed RNA polymerase subunit M